MIPLVGWICFGTILIPADGITGALRVAYSKVFWGDVVQQ
jgi:hypothetical protein